MFPLLLVVVQRDGSHVVPFEHIVFHILDTTAVLDVNCARHTLRTGKGYKAPSIGYLLPPWHPAQHHLISREE